MTDRADRECRRTRDRLLLHYYSALDADERAALVRHLASCDACAREWATTQRILGEVSRTAAFPRESEVDWERFARDTVARARLEEEGASMPAATSWLPVQLSSTARWGLAAAVGLALFFAIFTVGRPPSRLPEGPPVAELDPHEAAQFLQRAMAIQGATRTLREGRALLVNLVRTPVRCRRLDGEYDVILEKRRSHDLLRRTHLYRRELERVGDERLAALVEQLGVLLLQVSALQDCATAQQIHDMRQTIERRRILLRIDLVTREVEKRGIHV
jgi:hypothetical protein